jgi:copper resistance protein B
MISTKGLLFALAIAAWPVSAFAADPDDEKMAHEHGGQTFHAIRVETDFGQTRGGHDVAGWDIDGWIGTDTNKLWLKSEGHIEEGDVEEAELWALYSRNIATYWDAQIGLRQDFLPDDNSHAYLAAGVTGLAPYFFETEGHIFLRDDGALSARLRQENEWLLTNRLIVQPYAEANLNFKEDPELGLGTGLTSAQIGLQTRYEFSRKFAPYFDLSFQQSFGETADYARARGEDTQSTTLKAGIRLLF